MGYNPKKAWPSVALPSHILRGQESRLIIDAEVHSGKETAGRHSHAGLWELLDHRLPASPPSNT